jgi:hypothetical protein
MVSFGEMKRQDQQRAVIKKSQHTDYLAEGFDTASQGPRKHILFCLPFIMPAEAEDTIEANGARVMALQALNGHKICTSALMDLILARRNGGEPVTSTVKAEQCRSMGSRRPT